MNGLQENTPSSKIINNYLIINKHDRSSYKTTFLQKCVSNISDVLNQDTKTFLLKYIFLFFLFINIHPPMSKKHLSCSIILRCLCKLLVALVACGVSKPLQTHKMLRLFFSIKLQENISTSPTVTWYEEKKHLRLKGYN